MATVEGGSERTLCEGDPEFAIRAQAAAVGLKGRHQLYLEKPPYPFNVRFRLALVSHPAPLH